MLVVAVQRLSVQAGQVQILGQTFDYFGSDSHYSRWAQTLLIAEPLDVVIVTLPYFLFIH